jgi:hypothetical protein
MTASNVIALHKAAEAAERGIQSSAEHAESDSPGWQGRALGFLGRYAASQIASWTIEDFRLWAASHGLEQPDEARAYGSLTRKALQRGYMVRVGYAPTVSSRGGPKPLYARPAREEAA